MVLILFTNQDFKPYIIIIMITINNKYFPNPINITLRLYYPHSERKYLYIDDYESLKMLIGDDMTTRVLSTLHDTSFGNFSEKIAIYKGETTYIAFFILTETILYIIRVLLSSSHYYGNILMRRSVSWLV